MSQGFAEERAVGRIMENCVRRELVKCQYGMIFQCRISLDEGTTSQNKSGRTLVDLTDDGRAEKQGDDEARISHNGSVLRTNPAQGRSHIADGSVYIPKKAK